MVSSPLIKLSKYPPTQRNIKVTLGCNGILRILKRVRVSVIAKQGMLKGGIQGVLQFLSSCRFDLIASSMGVLKNINILSGTEQKLRNYYYFSEKVPLVFCLLGTCLLFFGGKWSYRTFIKYVMFIKFRLVLCNFSIGT